MKITVVKTCSCLAGVSEFKYSVIFFFLLHKFEEFDTTFVNVELLLVLLQNIPSFQLHGCLV